MPGPAAELHRLFFALWPDGRIRERLAALAADLPLRGGRRVRPENLHLTLAFLGEVPAAQAACLEAAAAGVRAAPFELVLDRLGGFGRTRVVWLGCRHQPEPLLALVRALNQALAEGCGYLPEARPFAAHLTVARRARHPPRPQDVGPVPWPVSEFVLVESDLDPEGVRYRLRRTYPLKA